jgi:hypothetical protein
MNRRRALVGLMMMCTLALCAFAAPEAQALQGTTIFTCESVKTGAEFSDEHCANKNGSGAGWKHAAIPENTLTATEATNAKTKNETKESTNAVMKVASGGETLEISCVQSKGEGALENRVVGGQMIVSGTVTINNSECTVKPAATECVVQKKAYVAEATVKSKVAGTAPNEEMYWEYAGAKKGGVFAEFTLEACKNIFQNGIYKVEGTGRATPHGATVEFLANEPKATLEYAAAKAEYISEETIRMKTGEPLSVTTTTT